MNPRTFSFSKYIKCPNSDANKHMTLASRLPEALSLCAEMLAENKETNTIILLKLISRFGTPDTALIQEEGKTKQKMV